MVHQGVLLHRDRCSQASRLKRKDPNERQTFSQVLVSNRRLNPAGLLDKLIERGAAGETLERGVWKRNEAGGETERFLIDEQPFAGANSRGKTQRTTRAGAWEYQEYQRVCREVLQRVRGESV